MKHCKSGFYDWNDKGTPASLQYFFKRRLKLSVVIISPLGSKTYTDIETANKAKQLKVVVDTSQPISIQSKNQTDLDVLIKLDLIDDENMKEVSEFLDKLLAQEKYEGRRGSNVKYVVE